MGALVKSDGLWCPCSTYLAERWLAKHPTTTGAAQLQTK